MGEKPPDLRTAYRTLDPAKPLDSYSTYYMQRPGDPIARLANEIKESSQPFRAIVVGQRGVGKTTELNRLKSQLEQAYRSVFLFDLGRVAASNATTALAFLAKELMLQATALNRSD